MELLFCCMILKVKDFHESGIMEVSTANAQSSVIYDLTGRKVLQGEYQPNISVSQLNNGLYFIQIVTAEGQVINQKFIISK